MKLSVVIVNYNVRYFLEQALLSVRRAARRVETEVWVVDNNSVDDSVAMVREKFPEVRLIANAHNPGFSVANNQAIRCSRGEYVLLLNPDTVVEEDTFEKCAAFMDAHPEAGGLGVRMIDGAGNFLPESKRGFPSPWVAFAKTFGLSTLFPKSRLFNHYHLGYLPEHEIHEVEVLAGAFMWLRRSVLDEIGWLDEAFFMYGEDIDLSYRIVRAGYRNYYFPHTSIIHYKGESTRKGSLNYVRTFYQAMIIFARKHFQGRRARLFVTMLQAAIYLRAAMTLLSNLARRWYLPLLDGLLIYLGLVFLKSFWASYHFHDPGYYSDEILYIHFPLYCLMWLSGIFFSGGYDPPPRLRGAVRGLLISTLLLFAIYGLLPEMYRPSRALLLLGGAWALTATTALRLLLHFVRHGNLALDRDRPRRLLIAGSASEAERVLQLLQRAGVHLNYIGRLRVEEEVKANDKDSIGRLDQLDEAVAVYRAEEIIFCSRDIATQQIMQWMTRLGPHIHYKILPEESLSIIGSHGKNRNGELYTIDIQFAIAQPARRRTKRLLDIGCCLFLLLTLPLQLLLVRRRVGLIANIFAVLKGRRTWVGYAPVATVQLPLPALAEGVLNTTDLHLGKTLTDETKMRLNLLYAKDYEIFIDVENILINWRDLGKNSPKNEHAP